MTTLRDDARAISVAAIAAVMPERLLGTSLGLVDGRLRVRGRPCEPPLVPGRFGRIVIVGAGKAAGGIAVGLEQLLEDFAPTGIVAVPEGCGGGGRGVEVRETRPAAVNLPTAASVAATREMLELIGTLGPDDLAIAVITGGGSALLEDPLPGVTLEEQIQMIRQLSAAGASIAEVNRRRTATSRVKGGGLARACRAGRLLAVVLSDVIGDDLEVIASGPCLPAGSGVGATAEHAKGMWITPTGCLVQHLLLGSNATAVEAAGEAAAGLGYRVRLRHADPGSHETADEVGRRLAAEGLAAADLPLAIIEGGEATVTVPQDHGRGGRNQQTAIAALAAVRAGGEWPASLLVASIGTDGEDGPTDAAGGLVDAGVAAATARLGLDPAVAVARCDALPLLEATGGLLRTGPTGTNVADVRIVLRR